ncbi:MAG TPA: sigma-54 dependent transcriptional regulator [Haliangiales bacterium]|nr:sigma-54 dependent transcriptional regulator [Haliangiales bacterium]
MLKVLIVDDQPAVLTALQLLFEIHGVCSIAAQRPHDVLDIISTEDIGLVVQDMNFAEDKTSGQEGEELFKAIRRLDPDMPVLLMTAWTSLETAVRLIKEGASDYMAKPWDDEKLIATVKNLLRLRELAQENLRLMARSARARRTLAGKYDLRGLIYASDAIHDVVSLGVAVASSDAPVLITGPNGSGKEKLADIIQANSRRRDKPFVKVNAGGLPDDLLEAELFGAEVGAFTGATRQRIGRFETAHGGTLFLDEIGNLSASGQMKLLRVLQTGEFERLGSSQTRRADARVISATNVDLPRAIAAGTFREDLFFRLNVIELHVPPLAERPEDILPLAEHFLRAYAPDGSAVLTDEARAALVAYEWPGNVRELANRIQRATLVGKGRKIIADDLGVSAPAPRAEAARPMARGEVDPERDSVEEALLRHKGVVSKAAAELGLSRQALYRRMERLAIVLERRPK